MNYIISFLLILSFPLLASDNVQPAKIDINKTWKSKRAEQYEAYSFNEINKIGLIFEALLANKITTKQIQQLSDFNLQLKQNKKIIVISESREPYRGQGLFIIRKSSSAAVLLQAPHAFHDIKTGSISIKLMNELKFKALAVNTVNRRYSSATGEQTTADMAHMRQSLFIAFSQAFVKVIEAGKIIQLHGFNTDKRSQTRNVDIILSNGTKNYTANNLIIQQSCIERELKLNVKVYPMDINRLGGTSNSIGRSIRNSGYNKFEHIEMSLSVRKSLDQSRKKRKAFIGCVTK